jgi:hypothetical protein
MSGNERLPSEEVSIAFMALPTLHAFGVPADFTSFVALAAWHRGLRFQLRRPSAIQSIVSM